MQGILIVTEGNSQFLLEFNRGERDIFSGCAGIYKMKFKNHNFKFRINKCLLMIYNKYLYKQIDRLVMLLHLVISVFVI